MTYFGIDMRDLGLGRTYQRRRRQAYGVVVSIVLAAALLALAYFGMG